MPPLDLNWQDFNEDGYTLPSEGPHLAEVTGVEVKRGKASGDQYLSLKLKDVDTGESLGFDVAMIEGSGRGMGLAKLRQLGAEVGKPLDPLTLVGRRVKVSIIHTVYEGQKQAKVNTRAEGFKCGYLAVEGMEAPHSVDDTPF